MDFQLKSINSASAENNNSKMRLVERADKYRKSKLND